MRWRSGWPLLQWVAVEGALQAGVRYVIGDVNGDFLRDPGSVDMGVVFPRCSRGWFGGNPWGLPLLTLAIVGLVLTGEIAGFREAAARPAEAAVVNPTKDADFNGDGYADLVIAAPSPSGDRRLLGVHVVYGSGEGLRTTESTFLDKADLPGVGEPTLQLDAAMVAADFSGDGYSDLVLSTPDCG